MRKLFSAVILVGWTILGAEDGLAFDRDLARFMTEKQAQIRELAGKQPHPVPSIVWSFFDAVRVDDWETATNLATRLSQASGRFPEWRGRPVSPALQSRVWAPLAEAMGAYREFREWDSGQLRRFGSNLVSAIPPGSIFFGGSDSGRFAVPALSESHREGRSFFALAYTQLTDETYRSYLETMYGSRLRLPTPEDVRKVLDEYIADARRRRELGQLKPGENVQVSAGKVQVSGALAWLSVQARLMRVIAEKNTARECYIEEGQPLEFLRPQLSPHGLVFRLHPDPLPDLSKDIVEKDAEFWDRFTAGLIGEWLDEKTSVRQLCDFAEKVYVRKDLEGFQGDAAFARNKQAQAVFSRLRTSIAGLYLWRAERANDNDEKARMRDVAGGALRQAIALSPSSADAVVRYCRLLQDLRRHDEAVLLAESRLRLNPDDPSLRGLLLWLRAQE